MKIPKLCRLAAALGLLATSTSGMAGTVVGPVTWVQIDSRTCVFFLLSGVTIADSAVNSSPWFALPKTAPMFNEMYALLLSGKKGQKQVQLQTDGSASCGYATAVQVSFPS